MEQQPYEIPIKSKYVSPDEFKAYTGKDLQDIFGDGENAFIIRTQVRLQAWLNCFGGQNVDKQYPMFSEYQKLEYKYALIEQMDYIIGTGDIGQQSGYDQDSLKMVSNQALVSKAIAPYAKMHLVNCGLLCGKIKNYGNGASLAGWLFR